MPKLTRSFHRCTNARRHRAMSTSRNDAPDTTLAELQAWLIAEHATKVSAGCLWKRLRISG
jgi:hypothetical protein